MAPTTKILRTIALLGHSNAQGLAGANSLVSTYPHLAPRFESNGVYWKDLFVFTGAVSHPGIDMTPVSHRIDEGEWLEMTVTNTKSPGDAHLYPSPYMYPNVVGAPYPHWAMEANTFGAFGSGVLTGIEIPLMWQLGAYWADQIGLVKLTVPSSLFLRYDLGGDPVFQLDRFNFRLLPLGSRPESTIDVDEYPWNSWWTPRDCFDFDPSTGRLYQRFIQKAEAARDAMPAGSVMSIDVLVLWFGDNDAPMSRDRVRYWGNHVKSFVSRIRQDLAQRNLSTLPAEEIRVVWMAVKEAYTGPNKNAEYMNAAAKEVADGDPYMTFIPTDSYTCHAIDPSHLNHVGYVEASRDVFEAIVAMDVDPYDSMDRSDRVTVAEVKERVRLYYARGKVNTDLADDVVIQHLNAAMHHCLHQCGDYAWFLRRRHEITLNGRGRAAPITLPRTVHRILMVEDRLDVTAPVEFQMIGHADGGKLQIVLPGRQSGDFVVHYIRYPGDLETDQQLIPVPKSLIEWLTVETCLRLARAAANPAQVAAWGSESMRLQIDTLKSISATQRAKKERLYTTHRLPNVLRHNRARRWDSSF